MRYLILLVIAGIVALFLWNGLPMLGNNLPKEQAHGCYSNEQFGMFAVRDGGIDYQGSEVFTRYSFVKGDAEGEKFLIAAPQIRFVPTGNTLSIDIIKDGQSAQQYLVWDDSGDTPALMIPVDGFAEAAAFSRAECPA